MTGFGKKEKELLLVQEIIGKKERIILTEIIHHAKAQRTQSFDLSKFKRFIDNLV